MSSPNSVGDKSETVEMLDVGEDTAETRGSTNVSGDDSTLRNAEVGSVSCKAEEGVSTPT